jgi:Plasmid encoded RepA protein
LLREMGEVHKLLAEHGKAKVLQLDLDRRVIEAAAGYMASEEGEVGFLYSGWAQSALPHKRIPDDASWQVHTDHVSLVVQPGLRPSLTGDAVSVGVPYGSRARLICLYLQSEALKTNSREVELGKTLHAWLRRLDISIGGTSMAAVRDQAERISRCRMSFQIKSGDRTGLVNQNILDTAMFVDDDSTQGSLFIEKAKLSEMFFDQLKKHPVPVEENAVKHISNNSMALDVYCWLAYRLHSLSSPKLVTWKALHAQFGRGLPRIDQFRWYFKKTLDLAMAVYPDARVDVDGRGLTLNPSRAPVTPRVLSLASKRLKS